MSPARPKGRASHLRGPVPRGLWLFFLISRVSSAESLLMFRRHAGSNTGTADKLYLSDLLLGEVDSYWMTFTAVR